MAEFLPDLVTRILLLLPVKTLLRFRCISKSLRGIIDSPDFIKSHLKTTSGNRTHRRIILGATQNRRYNPAPDHVFDMDAPFPPIEQTDDSGSPLRSISSNAFAHCNGLVLLEEFTYSLVVWNPTTQKCRKLPVLPREAKVDFFPPRIIGLCFGYDSSADDYKVLLIKRRTPGVAIYKEQYSIWILGFRSGYYWRRIESPFELHYHRNCFVDGAFHFKCGDNRVIFAFDLAKETFSEIPFPDLAPIFSEVSHPDFQDEVRWIYLDVLEGCLCIICSVEVQNYFELYARKKNGGGGGEFFWTKLYSISCNELSCIQSRSYFPYLRTGQIWGFSKDGVKIFFTSFCNNDDAFSYDSREKTIKKIVDGRVFSCIESLVWL